MEMLGQVPLLQTYTQHFLTHCMLDVGRVFDNELVRD